MIMRLSETQYTDLDGDFFCLGTAVTQTIE